MVKKSVNKKLLCFLMVIAMILSVPAASFAAAPEKPNVSITIANIKGSPDTLELSIAVPAGGNFKASGAVFEFDTTKLVPITWTSGTAISFAETTDAALGWHQASVIESICPDYLSGKPAMAYKDGATGYLYMGAEAAKAQTFDKDEKIVTVRFGYVGETTFTEVQSSKAIKFAQEDKVTYASPVKGKMLYQTENRDTGEYKFYYLDPVTSTDGGTTIVPDDSITQDENLFPDGEPSTDNGGVNEVPDGETVNTGTANSSDFASLTFYDWDNTLLGTRIVKKGDSLIDPNTTQGKAALETWKSENGLNGDVAVLDTQLAEAGFAPIAPEGNLLTGGNNVSGDPITAINKEGYTFAGWVDYSTGWSTPNVGLSTGNNQTISPTQTLVSLSNITESRVIKAAYDETGISNDRNSRRYDVYFSKLKMDEDGMYLQTEFTIKRSSIARRSATGTVLVINLRPAGLGETEIQIELGQKDIETYMLKIPTNAKAVYDMAAVSYSLVNGDRSSISRAGDISRDDIPQL